MEGLGARFRTRCTGRVGVRIVSAQARRCQPHLNREVRRTQRARLLLMADQARKRKPSHNCNPRRGDESGASRSQEQRHSEGCRAGGRCKRRVQLKQFDRNSDGSGRAMRWFAGRQSADSRRRPAKAMFNALSPRVRCCSDGEGTTVLRGRVSSHFFGRLTFDMRGGRQQAKPDVGRPLDGRVRPICEHRADNSKLS